MKQMKAIATMLGGILLAGAALAAQQDSSEASYTRYLNRYHSGRYIAAASAELPPIKDEEAKGPAMIAIPGKSYEMGKYEVTQAEWRAVMGGDPPELNFKDCDNCPVERVSWNDAHEFIHKLNQKTGKQYRLPTEAEWEYACYGGSQSEYCGGSDIDAVAWYEGNSSRQTHPVGQKQANGYGLHDMNGNVWEWMENKYDNEHDWRALRGGSWFNLPQSVRAVHRYFFWPTARTYYFGFRLARTLP